MSVTFLAAPSPPDDAVGDDPLQATSPKVRGNTAAAAMRRGSLLRDDDVIFFILLTPMGALHKAPVN